MNLHLMPHDINLEFYFYPPEIFKSDEEIKNCYYNNNGSVMAIVTKNNSIKIYDFMGKIVIFNLNYFKDNDKSVNYITWSVDSENIYVAYNDENSSGIKIVKLYFNYNIDTYYEILDDIKFDINIFQTQLYNNDSLLISGSLPQIFNFNSFNKYNFFDRPEDNYTYIVKETNESQTFLIIIKEIYLFLILTQRDEDSNKKNQINLDNMFERKLTDNQLKIINDISLKLNRDFVLIDIFGINNCEILQINMDMTKSLILINSSDRILRLYKFDTNSITLVKEYFDSVNRKKWINAYFYKFKIKNTYNDVIVSAIADVNSLEFIFIDINTGNYIKRLEPFKFNCNDFICHFKNHWSIIMMSNKKLFHMYGYLVNHWGAFAPQFKYIEENVEYIEEETFFDNFNKNLKKLQCQKVYSQSLIKNIFYPEKIDLKQENLFFKYIPTDDQTSLQSEKDLKEIFQHMNELLELKK